MHEDFVVKANIKRNEFLLQTEVFFVANKSKWFDDFAEHFRDLCAQVRKLQDELVLSAATYLEYTMLYTNFINRHYVADIFVYGEKGYLDKSQRFIGSYDISFLFVYYDMLWDDLLALKKRYFGKVAAKEITDFMIRTLPAFYSYFIGIVRFGIVKCIDECPVIDIDKNEEFMVNVGNYMAETETVYSEKKHKDANELTEWFNELFLNKYICGDYSNLDFTGKVFQYTDFRYARFQNSTLNNTNFEGSSLIGANFRNAMMEKCRIDCCSIFEADFSNAKLKGASFVNTRAKAGLTDEKEWKFAGFLPVNFSYADLTNAIFTGANLAGADFTGAILNGADFTDAVLDNAIF